MCNETNTTSCFRAFMTLFCERIFSFFLLSSRSFVGEPDGSSSYSIAALFSYFCDRYSFIFLLFWTLISFFFLFLLTFIIDFECFFLHFTLI